MINTEKLQQDINELPEDAQRLLIDFIEGLKQRYSLSETSAKKTEKTSYEQLEASGLIGFCSVEEDLSTTYKEVVAQALKLLQERELEQAYREASKEISEEWEMTVGDGLIDETW